MRRVETDAELTHLAERVFYHANQMQRTLPEVRFYILNSTEFASLLEKKVYPVSPVNIWEGKRMVTRKHRVQTGQESSLYYEVVQTGDPSYAYLNNTNSPMMQASVMAHVLGHCEFSELNVLRDSTRDRTEYVMYLVRQVNLCQSQMGQRNYEQYWNAVESAAPMIAPNSQFNFENSVDTDLRVERKYKPDTRSEEKARQLYRPVFSTLDSLMNKREAEQVIESDRQSKVRQEALSRRGYKLKAPCQDILAFLRQFAPASRGERTILNYFYTVHAPQEFVIKTQIMNEGWAMYWEKKLMLELFKEKAVKGIIDYARVFAGVCYPRPYYMRNPYHLGFHLWTHIEDMYREGRISLDYEEEVELTKKQSWHEENGQDPIENMEHLVSTITDYEFLRRFLTPALIHEFKLNRIPQRDAARLGISKKDVIDEDRHWVWLNPEPIKDEMLMFFTHFYRPRIYLIDTDFEDNGILLYHRDDGRRLKVDWIKPTLKNLNLIWKGPVCLYSRGTLYGYVGGRYKENRVGELGFDDVVDRMRKGVPPLVLK